MNVNKLEGTSPWIRIVYFRDEAKLNSELSWSRCILNSLIYTYSDEFISRC